MTSFINKGVIIINKPHPMRDECENCYKDFHVAVEHRAESKNYIVSYSAYNAATGRVNNREVTLSYSRRQVMPERDIIEAIAYDTLASFKLSALFGLNRNDPLTIERGHIKSLMLIRIRNALRSPKEMIKIRRRAQANAVERTEALMTASGGTVPFTKDVSNKYGIFWKERSASAKTKVILGSSFSGKTYFLASELNKLTKSPEKVYDKVFIFTESPQSEPLKKLNPRLNATIVPLYIPKIVQILKRINTKSDNHFRFLVVLDDVVSGIRAGTFLKQILTMRNSQISTCILLQYAKLVTPAARNSFHDYYIVQLRVDDWEYILKQFIGPLIKKHFPERKNYMQLAEDVKQFMQKQGRILHFDQVRDEISLIDGK